MAKTKIYQHFCPVARALEVIGEKWSLLIVRDLLRGPQRFSDLLRCVGGITPKWLTLRLRELEAAGIVEADRVPGRREVWYRLTSRGRELAPVVEALALWGIDHAMRPPLPGEELNPLRTTGTVALFLNTRRIALARPITVGLRLTTGETGTIRFDGDRREVRSGLPEAADLTIEAAPEVWIGCLVAPPEERVGRVAALQIAGDPDHAAEFVRAFGFRTSVGA